jgi:hypothetical protein
MATVIEPADPQDRHDAFEFARALCDPQFRAWARTQGVGEGRLIRVERDPEADHGWRITFPDDEECSS